MTDDGSGAYAEARGAVRQMVNRIDPMGLIAFGFPEDEYDAEVGDLVRLVMGSEDFGTVEIDGVWRRWFGDSYAGTDNADDLKAQADELRRLHAPFAPRSP